CLGLGRYALRRGKIHAIGVLKIAEGVVAGNDTAAIGGNFGDHLAHLAIKRVELGEIGCRIGGVSFLAGGVGGDQRVADIGDVDFRVGDRLPGVRIRSSVVVIMAPAGALERL